MRPQQQNRRMRGRNNNGGGGSSGGGGGNNNNNNNNGRKGPNPLTRNYESNGPDVKIRGSAQQIAEKYATLARDAHSAGDRVMSENYLQHAEHYNRIIAAAQAQMPIQQVQNNRDDFDDEDQDRDDFDNAANNQHGNVQQHNAPQHNAPEVVTASVGNNDGSGPQPIIEGMPAEVALNSEAVGENVNARGDNRGRGRGRRPAPSQAQPQDQPVEQTQPAAVEAENTGATEATSDQEEVAAAPRRGRRPRRGERQPVEGAGAEATAAETPAADAPGDDTALAAAVNG